MMVTTMKPPPVRPGPARSTAGVSLGPVPAGGGHRIVIYGPGGIGKTSLAATAPGPVAFADLDDSLPRLAHSFEGCDPTPEIQAVGGCSTWEGLRAALQAPGWESVKTVIIDSATMAEEMAVAWTLDNVLTEKGHKATSIEGYGYGKGYQHVYDTFLALLGDLDQHVRAGRHVILVCHDCTATVPNPQGEDWIRYEPRLQSPNSGKSSIRLRVREWADHLLFVGYDVEAKDGKARGSGTRTIYPTELPHCMAKSRTLADTLALGKFDRRLWTALLGKES